MSKRTGPNCALALLMLFVGTEAISRSPANHFAVETPVFVSGIVADIDADTGIATIGDSFVYVGDVSADIGVSLAPGDEVSLLGTPIGSSGLVLAITIDFVAGTDSHRVVATAAKQSITGT